MFDLNIHQQNHYYHLYKENMYQNKSSKKKCSKYKYKIVKKLFSIIKKKSFVLKY